MIGNGWGAWSNGYAGDVYESKGATSVTMTLPAAAAGFYFYAESATFSTYSLTATANDGSSLTESINGFQGASGFGLSARGGTMLTSVTLSTTTDFEVGEFGICVGTASATPESSTLVGCFTASGIMLGYALRRRKAKSAA